MAKEKNRHNSFLFVCAHPDDDSLVGGTMKKLADQGWDVFEASCATGKKAFRAEGEDGDIKENRVNETKSYCELLGAHPPIILDGKKRLFQVRHEIVLKLAGYMRKVRPDIIVLLNKEDYHFEHRVCHDIGLLAFEVASRKTEPQLGEVLEGGVILQTDGLNLLPNPLIAFDTSETHEEKIRAIQKAYKLRLEDYLVEFVDGLAKTRGSRVGYRYAECYEMLNPPWFKFRQESSKALAEFTRAAHPQNGS